jgi:hypothetical protein
MAELLVYAANRRDELLDNWQYGPGDGIVVKPDGHVWGAGESMAQWRTLDPAEQDMVPRPPFTEVSVPGLSVDDADVLRRRALRPSEPGDPNYDRPDPEDRFEEVFRRAWRVRFDRLDEQQRRDAGIWGNGWNPDQGDWALTLTVAEFGPAMQEKLTLATYDSAAPDYRGAVVDDGEPNYTGVPLIRRADRT